MRGTCKTEPGNCKFRGFKGVLSFIILEIFRDKDKHVFIGLHFSNSQGLDMISSFDFSNFHSVQSTSRILLVRLHLDLLSFLQEYQYEGIMGMLWARSPKSYIINFQTNII